MNTLAIPGFTPSNAEVTDATIRDNLSVALRAIRTHLGMTVAFVSEFTDGQRVFRYVDSALGDAPIRVGQAEPLDETYCQRVVDGRLPELIRNASRLPAARELPATKNLPVGAHLSVPITLEDGSLYGTFCCFSSAPDPSLKARDLAMMRVFAEFTGKQIEKERLTHKTRDETLGRIQSIIDEDSFSVVYQPIFDLGQNRIVGFESLTRFAGIPVAPDAVFKEAAQVGLSQQLEIGAIRKALANLRAFPEDTFTALNISPDNIANGAVGGALLGVPLRRIVLEVTEYVSVADYAQFASAIEPFRRNGLRLAIDDAGAGYASFRHILKLQPDIIKLDMSLTRDIDTDQTRRALAAALIRFAQETGSLIIAEGVETEAELSVLRRLHVNEVQGYLIGRPVSLDGALALLKKS